MVKVTKRHFGCYSHIRQKVLPSCQILVSLGHFKVPGGDFEGCGMGQFDPQQDLEYIKLREQYAKIPEKDKRKTT